METRFNEDFNLLLEKAKTDSNIIGLFLIGSRGKGFENQYSDYDIKIITSNEATDSYINNFMSLKSADLDLSILSLSDFRDYAEWDTPFSWDRYAFSHVIALLDKTGEIQKIIDEKGFIPAQKQQSFLCGALDGYINQVYRSVKCFRNQNITGAHLEASASIPCLLDVVFAYHGRHKPFLSYLEQELIAYPLEKLPWKVDEFIKKILQITSTGNLIIQQEILKTIEAWSREEGFGSVFDSWEGKDKWAMTYRHDDGA